MIQGGKGRGCTGSLTKDIRIRFLNREVIGIALLSGAGICATILLVWACITRGECTHSGQDSCESRKNADNAPGFQGNNDFYGIGIRLGIYCQWAASLIANAVLDQNVRRTTTAPYVGFQIAVLAALLLLVFQTDCTFTAEIVITLYILLGGIFIVLAPKIVQSFRRVQWHEKQRPKYQLSSTVVWILVGWVVPISAWFWIRLADSNADQTDFQPTPGGTSIFLLAHIEDHRLRIASGLMAAWSLMIGLFAMEKVALAFVYRALDVELRPVLLMLLDVLGQVVYLAFVLLKSAVSHVVVSCQEDSSRSICESVIEALELRKDVSVGDITRRSSASSTLERIESSTRVYTTILSIISTILSICSVELTLVWNHITGVNSFASTGQIVPLFVGLVTLLAVLWQLLKTTRSVPSDRHEATDKTEDDSVFYDEACMWQTASDKTFC